MFPPQAFQSQDLYSLSGRKSYRNISCSLEAARLDIIMIVLDWNSTGISAALLPRCLSNFRVIGKVQIRISWLRDCTRSYDKTSVRSVTRGPGAHDVISLCGMSGPYIHYHLQAIYGTSNVSELLFFNPSWPSDIIWRHRSGSTLAQVMACCHDTKPLPEPMSTYHLSFTDQMHTPKRLRKVL